MGDRRTIVVIIPLKGTEGKIDSIVVITTVKASGRTTEKLFFCRPHPRLRNRRGPPSPPLDWSSGQRRRSATRSPSSPRHESALQPPSQTRHEFLPAASDMSGA